MGYAALLATQNGVLADLCMRAARAGCARLRRNTRYGRIRYSACACAARRGGMVTPHAWMHVLDYTKFSEDGSSSSTFVSATRTVSPETSKFSDTGTCKKYRCTVYSGTASDENIMKNMTYRVLDPGFMHA
jgi:hypothetical protein